jgi:hypothetical protein
MSSSIESVFLNNFLELVKEATCVKRLPRTTSGSVNKGYSFHLRHMPAEFYVDICIICAHPKRKNNEQTKKAHLSYTPHATFKVSDSLIWYDPVERGSRTEEVVAEMLCILDDAETKKKEKDTMGILEILELK